MTHPEELHDHDRGLSSDLPRLLSRRRALTLLGGAGLAAVTAACTSDSSATSAGTAAATAEPQGQPAAPDGAAAQATAIGEIPEDTAGPFPGDGSNGVNVLTES